MATRAEIDAWVAAGPIREMFRLTRVDLNSRTRSQANKLEDGVIAMRKLKAEMLALRAETRSALKLLLDSVLAVRLLLPPSRPDGYGPLVGMYTDMDTKRRLHKNGKKLNLIVSKSNNRQRKKSSFISNVPRPIR
jgi:hypothetical protein